jgi:hypothetical protein
LRSRAARKQHPVDEEGALSDRTADRRRSALTWTLVWAGLLLLWFALAGTVSASEALVGAAGAALGATAAEAVRRQGLVHARPRARWLRHGWRLPGRVMVDFGRVMGVLARRMAGRRVLGRFRAIPFPVGGGDERSTARRAVATVAGSLAANGYVLGFDGRDNLVLVHELAAGDRSPIPGHEGR